MNPLHLSRGALAMRLSAAVFAVAPLSLAAAPQTGSSDRHAIEVLLDSYTRCVTQHDEAGFRALLLDDAIPFAAVGPSTASIRSPDLRQYEGFRQAVFARGQRYRQTFSNVHIEQHGVLAQVSLDFVTEQVSPHRRSSAGWKVLQLVRVGERWKIASELYVF
jgi:SnoaL-like domain